MSSNKTCEKCHEDKSLSLFRRYDTTKCSNTCKSCLNKEDKLRKKNARKKHQETTMVTCEKCNVEKALKYFAKLKKFYKKKICASCYPDFVREQKSEWCKNERNTNVNYRIKKSLAARMRSVLTKENSTMNYIGCNVLYLREWFEFNFTPEMNWDNYGSFWSIDHIIPVSRFDLTIEDEKLKCWNWSNMMPTTITYNSSKKQQIDMKQVEYIIERLNKFKEEGSTTKWFSREYLLNKTVALALNNAT